MSAREGGELNVPRSDDREKSDIFPWFLIVAIILVVAVFMFLFVSIVHSSQQREEQKTQAEKTRGDLLQQSVDSLRQHLNAQETAATQDRAFFELVRQLLVAQSQDQKKALLNQLRSFTFTEPETTKPASSGRGSTTTTTTKPGSPPTTRAPPPSTTTTTPPSPTTTVCVGSTVTTICTPRKEQPP